jgi:hypothetical protein
MRAELLNHQLLTIGQVVAEGSAPLLFSCELDSGHCGALLPV